MQEARRDAGRVTRSYASGVVLVGAVLAGLGCSPEGGSPLSPPAGTSSAAASKPAAAFSAAALQKAVLASEDRIRADGAGFAATSRDAGLRARWSAAGDLRVRRSRGDDRTAGELRLQTVGVGRSGGGRALGDVPFALGRCRSDGARDERGACLQRLERRAPGLAEWWENRSDGIEHGFVVDAAPAGRQDGWLQVRVRVDGARIAIAPGGQGALLAARGQRFRYDRLAAWGADRQPLPTRMRRAGRHLLLEVDDRQARYPVVIDPLLTLDTWGYESNQATAPPDQPAGQDMVVAGAGDVNGDGHLDVLVSFPRYNSPAGDNSGIVHLFLGSPTGPSTTPAWSSEGTDAGNATAGPTPSTLFGRSIAAGNINGDAFADVVIGQVGWGNGQALEGRVYVFFGQAGPTPLPALANRVIEGRSVNALFGRAVALGNLDGAGGDDLVVGSSGFNGGAGRVEIYLSAAGGALPMDGAPTDTMLGEAGASLGESVATGDVNGDGRADVHAAARTQVSRTQTQEGALYSAITGSDGKLGTPFVFASQIEGGQLGKVAFAGDVNGDGFGDVAAGVPAPIVGRPGFQATVYVMYGSATGLRNTGNATIGDRCGGVQGVCTLIGSTLFGAAVAGPVDVDKDGFFDVVAGAPGANSGPGPGNIYVIRGSASGPVVDQAYLVDSDSRYTGQANGDGFGSTVAIAGDLNKDGFVDLLAGAPGHENGAETDEGRAYLFLGGPATAKTNGTACVMNGECASGFCVDGVCCNTICGGSPGVEADNTSDCQACATTGATRGTCGIAALASPCRTNLCLEGSICDETGACVGGLLKSCPGAGDACRQAGVCDPATGMCTNPPRPDGTTCDDGNACTGASSCQAGTCTGPVTVTCPAPATCKLPGACDPATGACSYPNIPDDTTCDDGNLCTSGERCQAGACVTTPALTCGAESACKNAGSCDPATGICSQTNKADGTTCEDGNQCTVGSTCSAGTCSAGTARNCNDDNPCTSDSCVAATGCVHAVIATCLGDAGSDAPDAADSAPTDATDTPSPDTPPGDSPPGTDSPGADGPGQDRTPDTGGPIADGQTGDRAPDGTGAEAGTGRARSGGGCGCRLGGDSGATGWLAPLLGLGLLLMRRRRPR